MEISIKERQRYRDITWLMPSIDVEDVLRRLNSRIARRSGDEIMAFCPDHHLFVGREPSHPKWTINIVTGKTYCFTESRGSNLVWIVCRLLDCGTKEAVKFLTGLESDRELSALRIAGAKNRIARIKNKPEDEEKKDVRLNEVGRGLEARHTSQRLYEFFIHPPGKKLPTNIRKETVDRYQVFEMTWGFYIDRAVIPFFSQGELVGHCAVDLLGLDEWLKKYPLKKEEDYRKTRYPANFPIADYLFGVEDCEKSPDLVIVTEGAREVMKLRQERFDGVAVLGSRIHTPQIRLLAKLAPKEVALMYDGDEPGWAATDRDVKVLARLFKVIPCYLPIGCDPKNLDRKMLKKTLEKFRKMA